MKRAMAGQIEDDKAEDDGDEEGDDDGGGDVHVDVFLYDKVLF